MPTAYDEHREFLIDQILAAIAELMGYLAAQQWAAPPGRYDSPMIQARYMRGFKYGKSKLKRAPEPDEDETPARRMT